ncbi:MAG TPA: sulfatase-like hydrolase/transferase [Chloroflexota bacterium]|nr:sulfatase-like hydrolase/transferase [Chloroflexota bacterium]
MPTPHQPNILLITTDQHQAAALSCAGNLDVRTPNLDSLAARGVRFASAYSTFPLCTPARASLFTGRMPHAIDAMGNGRPIPEQYRSQELGTLFQAGGYDCAYGGKWHVPRITMEEGHGFRRIAGFNDNLLPGACIEFLRQRRDQPFFLVASFDNPHNICEHSRNQPLPWGEVPLAPIEECPNLPANFAAGPYEPEAIAAYAEHAPKVRRRPAFTPDRWRLLRHVYYRLIEKVDAQIGQILDALRETGQEGSTVVLFTSDHGEMAGAHQLNQKHSLYDESARVPFIVAGPGVRSGHVADQPVSLLDVLPTLCDVAGVSAPSDLPGLSLRPALHGESLSRDTVVIQSLWADEINGPTAVEARAIVSPTHKYVVHEWGENREQLFDRTVDPGEMINLALEARYRPLFQEYRDRLRQWCLENGDRFASRIHTG